MAGPMFPQQDRVYPNGTEYGSSGETVRVYAAIHLRVPMSGIPALDAMIRESRRLDFITATLTGDRANGNIEMIPGTHAKEAVAQANELAALKATFGEGGEA